MSPAQAAPFFRRHRLAIGVQLYTVRAEAWQDLPGVLKTLAGIGYQSVELAGLLGRTAREMRAALDEAGLRCPSAHFQPRSFGADLSFSGDLALMADTLHTIGADTAVVPIPPIPDRLWPSAPKGGDLPGILRQMTLDDWRQAANYLNEKARLLRAEGIRLAYHNHNVELAALGDTSPMEILLTRTDPRLVTFELDVGWAVSAGVAPVALFGRHPERFSMTHVKDIKPINKPDFAMVQESRKWVMALSTGARCCPRPTVRVFAASS